jgi:hypothetical protein
MAVLWLKKNILDIAHLPPLTDMEQSSVQISVDDS